MWLFRFALPFSQSKPFLLKGTPFKMRNSANTQLHKKYRFLNKNRLSFSIGNKSMHLKNS